VARWFRTVACVLLLLAPTIAAVAQVASAPLSTGTLPLEMGFGPSSLRSLDGGIPVYARGDELWVMNTYNTTATLTFQAPQGGSPKASISLPSKSAELLYTFPASATAGLWSLNSTWVGLGNLTVPVEVSPTSATGVQGGLVSASVSGSSLTLNYSLALGSADDAEAFLSDASLSGEAVLQIPAAFGSGSLGVQLANDSGATVTMAGSISTPFAFWVELYHDFSYTQLPTLGYTTSPVMAARSQAVQVAPGLGVTQAAVETELVLRQGSYTMRAYFRSGAAISVVETTMLLLRGGGWIWMDTSSGRAVPGSSIAVTADLAKTPWPAFLIVTYRNGGVGSYVLLPLGVTPGSVTFTVPPWEGTPSDVSISLRPDPSVLSYDVIGGTVYVVGNAGAFHLAYDLALGNHTFLSSTLDLEAGSSSSASIQLGELIVNSTIDGRPASGAKVNVSDGLGGTVAHAARAGGDAVFFLPPGRYNVTVSEGTSSSSQTVEVAAAQSQRVYASLSSSTFDPWVPLLVLATFGVALNIWVWIYRPYSLASTSRATK
jgi:hypothetical protein